MHASLLLAICLLGFLFSWSGPFLDVRGILMCPETWPSPSISNFMYCSLCKRKHRITTSKIQDLLCDEASLKGVCVEFMAVIRDIKQVCYAQSVPQLWNDSIMSIPSTLQLRSRCWIQPITYWFKCIQTHYNQCMTVNTVLECCNCIYPF